MKFLKVFAIIFLLSNILANNAFAQDKIANDNNNKPIEVMILGTYHFSGSKLDIVKSNTDSPLSPERQKEISDVAIRLSKFAPNKIALESYETKPDFTMDGYKNFKPEDLNKKTNEIYQIGYRLANMLHHENVYGLDEESDTIDYFPFNKVAEYSKIHNLNTADEIINEFQVLVNNFEESQKTKTVRELLKDMNNPKTIEYENQFGYYGLLSIGDSVQQPGAELNAYWYMRNAKIFSKLIQISKPGDKIIIVFGAGHSYWLRHFVTNTKGFKLVEPNKYLK